MLRECTKGTFIFPEDPVWRNFLERVRHDFYHLPSYVAAAAQNVGGRPLAFYAAIDHSAVLIPLILRPIQTSCGDFSKWCDVTSPYGYSSPLSLNVEEGKFAEKFWRVFMEFGAKQHLVSAFIRFHPLFPAPVEHLDSLGWQLVRHGQTVFIDLSLEEQELRRQTRKNHRKDVEKLLKRGYRVVLGNWHYFAEFKQIYRETMGRLGAEHFYSFSDAYFDSLKRIDGYTPHLAVVLAPDDSVASAGLITETQQILDFHLLATANRFVDESPSKLLFDFVRRWGRERGAAVFHLGGGFEGKTDSLFRFKAGFSEARADYYTARHVFHPELYTTIVRSCLSNEESADLKGDFCEFFPAYRKERQRTDLGYRQNEVFMV